jgi:hypothetical protein
MASWAQTSNLRNISVVMVSRLWQFILSALENKYIPVEDFIASLSYFCFFSSTKFSLKETSQISLHWSRNDKENLKCPLSLGCHVIWNYCDPCHESQEWRSKWMLRIQERWGWADVLPEWSLNTRPFLTSGLLTNLRPSVKWWAGKLTFVSWYRGWSIRPVWGMPGLPLRNLPFITGKL